MQPTQPKAYNISDLADWYEKKTLILQPKFQRRAVWTEKARSFLIDTILRGLPVPKLFIRQKIDLDRSLTIREVVDGQQRLRAVFDFLEGNLKVLAMHNQNYCNKTFQELPEDVRKDFLAYQFSVDVLMGASDREVLDVFTRINSYTLTLKTQEKLNAAFTGAFKQTVYNLGWDHLEFWRKNEILSDQKIARMGEAELASELIVAMIDGLQQGKKSLILYYKEFDDCFLPAKDLTNRFHDLIDLIAYIFGDKLSKTPYHRVPLFYSLFCVLYDCKYGLPKTDLGRVTINDKNKGQILQALIDLGSEMTSEEPKPEYVELRQAYIRSTDKLKERYIRHKYLWSAINSAAKISK